MFDPQFIIALDDISPVLFRLSQYPRDRVMHLGIIIDDISIANFMSSPMGMLMSAQLTGDYESLTSLLTYLSLPVPLRCNKLDFEYAVQPYIVDVNDTIPELSLCEFFEELMPQLMGYYLENGEVWSYAYEGEGKYLDGLPPGEVVGVCVTHENTTRFLGTPMGLLWLAQVTVDDEMYRIIHKYLGGLKDMSRRLSIWPGESY